jgi:acid phosphatase class B
MCLCKESFWKEKVQANDSYIGPKEVQFLLIALKQRDSVTIRNILHAYAFHVAGIQKTAEQNARVL